MSDSKRFQEWRREELTAEQQAVFDLIAAPRRGIVPVPFHILLETPELASLIQALGAFCRYRTGFPPHLSELMVLITATHWGAEYEFAVHVPEARKAGITEDAIAALRDGNAPKLEDPDSKLVYEFATAFYSNRDVPESLFKEAVARFGRPRVVEFAGVLGYYSMLAVLLQIFKVGADAAK